MREQVVALTREDLKDQEVQCPYCKEGGFHWQKTETVGPIRTEEKHFVLSDSKKQRHECDVFALSTQSLYAWTCASCGTVTRQFSTRRFGDHDHTEFCMQLCVKCHEGLQPVIERVQKALPELKPAGPGGTPFGRFVGGEKGEGWS